MASICSHCGQALTDGVEHCTSCGRSVPGGKRFVTLFVALVLILAALGGVGYYCYYYFCDIPILPVKPEITNSAGEKGGRNLASRYLDQADKEIKARNFKEAEDYLNQAADLALNSEQVRAVRGRLTQAKERAEEERQHKKDVDRGTGTAAYEAGRFNDALTLLKPLAEEGDAWAQHLLGMMYLNPYGISGFSKDVSEAYEWFRKAAEQGLVNAQYSMGNRCFREEDAYRDYAVCAIWMRKAAEQGHPNAQNDLADMYSEGVGVQRDLSEAKEWYSKAAAQGHKQAQLQLQKLDRLKSPNVRELWPGGPKFEIEWR